MLTNDNPLTLRSVEHLCFFKPYTLTVLTGDDWFARDQPLNRQIGIIPDQAAFMFWSPIVSCLVETLGKFREGYESVSKTDRNPQLALVVRRQGHADPMSEGRGASPEVNRDVKDFACDHANQFGLRLFDLVVQPTQDMSG